jgi:tetratricopeptide (TPR) repeat protein
MIVPRMLSSEYLQRYRERGDVGDILRAQAAAQTSLAAMPRNNMAGDMALASADLALHRFRDARGLIAAARRVQPDNKEFALGEASVDMELGDYAAAGALIAANTGKGAGAEDVIASRYAEITGHVADAQARLNHAMHLSDSLYDMPAERRAWYHFRMGELNFLRGDSAGAIAAEHDALAIFGDDVFALSALARFELADKQFAAASADARRASALLPSPETLGILADAQSAQGDAPGAAASRAQIDAEEKIGNAQHVNDRLIAMYLADHDLRPADAYAIARRELTIRDDVYAEDTLAWCAAKAGAWAVARAADAKALRFDTEDPRMQYHAGVIAQHFGDASEARRRYMRALTLNPRFSATQADDAREQIARLGGR